MPAGIGAVASSFYRPRYANPAAWYDPYNPSGVGVAITNNTALGTWVDLTANAINITQLTGSKQPTYLSAGLNSSYPCISFDHTNLQVLTNAGGGSLTLTGDQTFIFVFSVPAITIAKGLFSHYGTASPFNGWGIGISNATTHLCDYWSSTKGSWQPLSNTAIDDSVARVLTVIRSGSTVTGYINGVAQLTITGSGNPSVGSAPAFGANQAQSVFTDVKFGTIIIIGRAVSATEQTLNEHYAAKTAGITI